MLKGEENLILQVLKYQILQGLKDLVLQGPEAVSYTHLTLPTKVNV